LRRHCRNFDGKFDEQFAGPFDATFTAKLDAHLRRVRCIFDAIVPHGWCDCATWLMRLCWALDVVLPRLWRNTLACLTRHRHAVWRDRAVT
jgi:hypothetical protein